MAAIRAQSIAAQFNLHFIGGDLAVYFGVLHLTGLVIEHQDVSGVGQRMQISKRGPIFTRCRWSYGVDR